MDVLGVLNLGDVAQTFSKIGTFPVFDLAYYIVSILYLKYEPGKCFFFFIPINARSKNEINNDCEVESSL